MFRLKSLGKDHYGGLLLIVLGVAVLVMGVGYKTGTLNRMGAGFIPVVLGALLILVGVAIGATASSSESREMVNPLPGHGSHGVAPDWRAWICILAGVIAFVVVGQFGGLLPATFVSVFISAMGDRSNTFKNAAILGAVLTVFCLVVFHYALSVQLPLFQWGS